MNVHYQNASDIVDTLPWHEKNLLKKTKKEGKLMSTKFKLILGILILIIALALGTNVQAAEFESRLFVPSSLSMNGSGKAATIQGILENLGSSSWQDPYPFKDYPGGSVKLTAAEIVASKNLFCVNKPVKLKDDKLTYTGDGVVHDTHDNTRKGDILDYIYSEAEGQRQHLADSQTLTDHPAKG